MIAAAQVIGSGAMKPFHLAKMLARQSVTAVVQRASQLRAGGLTTKKSVSTAKPAREQAKPIPVQGLTSPQMRASAARRHAMHAEYLRLISQR